MRPKSIATVVVVLSSAEFSGSIVLLAWVIHASVFTGGISETELTSVVLPTPNPPATTILTDVRRRGRPSGKLTESMDDFLQKARVVRGVVGLRIDQHPIARRQVAQQHAGDSKGDPA